MNPQPNTLAGNLDLVKTALVLSAGGLFGAYQAGVWRELAAHFRPDLVVGASIGSLNGWMIAGGIGGEELVADWLRPPGGGFRVLTRETAERHVRRIYDAWRPRIPYGLVATQLPGFQQRLFEGPAITWRHLAGSVAIPLFLRHQRIDGRLLADGGLLTPLPLWAAVEMGATRIVAVNVLEYRPAFIRAFAATASRYAQFRPDLPEGVEVHMIRPEIRVGTMRQSVEWSEERIVSWIDRGRRDARLALPALAGAGLLATTSC